MGDSICANREPYTIRHGNPVVSCLLLIDYEGVILLVGQKSVDWLYCERHQAEAVSRHGSANAIAAMSALLSKGTSGMGTRRVVDVIAWSVLAKLIMCTASLVVGMLVLVPNSIVAGLICALGAIIHTLDRIMIMEQKVFVSVMSGMIL